LRAYGCVFYFPFIYLHVCAYAIKFKVHCGSAFEPGASGLPYYCTPPVFVPGVIGGLAVWRHNNNKTKTGTRLRLSATGLAASPSHGAGCRRLGWVCRPWPRQSVPFRGCMTLLLRLALLLQDSLPVVFQSGQTQQR